MRKIVPVNFHGNTLVSVRDKGVVFVALRPIVEGMGLDWSSQLKRVRRNHIFSEGVVMMTIPFGSGGPQEQACLKLNLLPGWLVNIDTERVKESLRDRIQLYQRECYDVLYRHFFGGTPMQSPGYERRSIEMVKQARLLFGRPAGARVWRERGLPMVPEMDEVFSQLDLFVAKKVA